MSKPHIFARLGNTSTQDRPEESKLIVARSETYTYIRIKIIHIMKTASPAPRPVRIFVSTLLLRSDSISRRFRFQIEVNF